MIVQRTWTQGYIVKVMGEVVSETTDRTIADVVVVQYQLKGYRPVVERGMVASNFGTA